MEKERPIVDSLNITKVNGRKRSYSLSYVFKDYNKGLETKDPQDMTAENIMCYLVKNYKNNIELDKNSKNSKNNIELDKNKLINDLVIFKSYKEDLEINIKSKELIPVFSTGIITVFTALASLNLALKTFYDKKIWEYLPKKPLEEPPLSPHIPQSPIPHESIPVPDTGPNNILSKVINLFLKIKNFICEIFKAIMNLLKMLIGFLHDGIKDIFNMLKDSKGVVLIFIMTIILTYVYYRVSTGRKSKYNKLKAVNNVIIILEEIRIDMEANPEYYTTEA